MDTPRKTRRHRRAQHLGGVLKGQKVVLLEKRGRAVPIDAIGGKLQLEAGIDLGDPSRCAAGGAGLAYQRGDYRVVKAWVDNSAERLDWAADMLTNRGITIAPTPMEM